MRSNSKSSRRAPTRRLLLTSAWASLLLVPAGLLLSGCGGGTDNTVTRGATTGSLRFTIAWPPPLVGGAPAPTGTPPTSDATTTRAGRVSRLIPAAAQSVVLDVYDINQKPLAHQVVSRPAGQSSSEATFNSLPAVLVVVAAQAHPNVDGSGVTQAQASTQVTVQGGQTLDTYLTMSSSIDHVDITPINATILTGASKTFLATPKDAHGNVVLTTPNDYLWTNHTPAFATMSAVNNTAILQGIAPGTVQLSVTENESQRVGAIAVTIVGAPGTAAINVH